MMRPTISLAALAVILAPGCAQPPAVSPQTAASPPAAAVQDDAMPGVKRATTCVFPTFRANQFGGAVTITASNDGTCGRNLSRQGYSGRNGSGFTVYSGGRVTSPAQHGQAQVTLLPDARLRVAYTAGPGYVGPDSFEYVPQPGNVTITVTVNVVAPGAS